MPDYYNDQTFGRSTQTSTLNVEVLNFLHCGSILNILHRIYIRIVRIFTGHAQDWVTPINCWNKTRNDVTIYTDLDLSIGYFDVIDVSIQRQCRESWNPAFRCKRSL